MATLNALYSSYGSNSSVARTASVECTSANARITYPPATGAFYMQAFEVRGWATAPDFDSYSLLLMSESEYASQARRTLLYTPEGWSAVVNRRPYRPRNNIVAEASEMAPFLSRSGVYRLRLVVHQHAGPDIACDRLVSLVLVGNK